MSPQDKRVPKAIRRRPEGVEIEWGGAGETVLLPYRELRLACPCAGCVDEMSRRPLLDPATVAADVRAESLELVGAYGVKIRWSDGHSTGIYTFEWLRGGGTP
jgi:ATP-binding protein involved in chromosome partitioning